MKKIINGKKYDTNTAKEITYASNGYGVTDFNYSCETIYQKKTGEFFLHGEGGPLSKYRESEGHGWCSGESIVPLTIEEAKEWMEKNASADTYESIFGEVEE